jgi:hypothetical protein
MTAKITKVTTDDSCTYAVIETEDGEITLKLTAACCSNSYFEERSVDDLKELVGKTIVKMEYVSSGRTDFEEGLTKYHALQITTEDGVLTVDWCNESNGYPDGNLEVEGFPCEGDSYV